MIFRANEYSHLINFGTASLLLFIQPLKSCTQVSICPIFTLIPEEATGIFLSLSISFNPFFLWCNYLAVVLVFQLEREAQRKYRPLHPIQSPSTKDQGGKVEFEGEGIILHMVAPWMV